ncbi:MAG: hypothetical protein ABF289_15095, partial [Clostridiales bacterium]
MAIIKDLNELKTVFKFHKNEHKNLTNHLLKKLSTTLRFRLKVQKASIQLIDKVPFAVIGLRRSCNYIFFEFYNSVSINTSRAVKTVVKDENKIINRINILSSDCIDDEILE